MQFPSPAVCTKQFVTVITMQAVIVKHSSNSTYLSDHVLIRCLVPSGSRHRILGVISRDFSKEYPMAPQKAIYTKLSPWKKLLLNTWIIQISWQTCTSPFHIL